MKAIALLALICIVVLSSAPADALVVSLKTGSLTFPATTLTGMGLSVTADAAPTWRVDASGETSGWNVTLQLSDFTTGSRTLPAANLRYTASNGTVVAVSGQAVDPTNGPRETGNTGTLDSPQKCITTNAGAGNGVYDWTVNAANFVLTVPASAYAGSYSATLTATVTLGP